jgi:putative ABC transport system substrate-binding protein
MRRREFIAALGGAAAWPLAARAQPAGKLPTIGFLGGGTASGLSQRTAAFVQRLSELGWIEGRTIAIAYRWTEGRSDRAAEIAVEFVRLKVDVIVMNGTESVIAAKQATAAIPIVAAVMGDPLESGLVASLARPGGNVTGLSLQNSDTAGKRVELLTEVVPGLRRLAIMANGGNRSAVVEMVAAEEAARTLRVETSRFEVRRTQDIAPAFEKLAGRADALYIGTDPLLTANRIRVNTLAIAARLPTISNQQEYVESGGLMSYGPNFPDLYRRAADFVDKILRGTKPADIPVEQPVRFGLVVNMITAKALGLTVPPSIRLRADEVIE